jgi:hypothetical protein
MTSAGTITERTMKVTEFGFIVAFGVLLDTSRRLPGPGSYTSAARTRWWTSR